MDERVLMHSLMEYRSAANHCMDLTKLLKTSKMLELVLNCSRGIFAKLFDTTKVRNRERRPKCSCVSGLNQPGQRIRQQPPVFLKFQVGCEQPDNFAHITT